MADKRVSLKGFGMQCSIIWRMTYCLSFRCHNSVKHFWNGLVISLYMWKTEKKGGSPRLLITDMARWQLLIAQVHNEVGHWGHDATYKLLYDCYYWPDLYDSVAYFVWSCYACQLHSRFHPWIPFSVTWNSAILRCFDLDMIHMEEGHGRKHYLLQAIKPAIAWPEACASAKNNSEAWALFIYQEIICRFRCIPFVWWMVDPNFWEQLKSFLNNTVLSLLFLLLIIHKGTQLSSMPTKHWATPSAEHVGKIPKVASLCPCGAPGYAMHSLPYDWLYTLLPSLWPSSYSGILHYWSDLGSPRLAYCS